MTDTESILPGTGTTPAIQVFIDFDTILYEDLFIPKYPAQILFLRYKRQPLSPRGSSQLVSRLSSQTGSGAQLYPQIQPVYS